MKPRKVRLSLWVSRKLWRVYWKVGRLARWFDYKECERCGKWQRGGTRQINSHWQFLFPDEFSREGFYHDIDLCRGCYSEAEQMYRKWFDSVEWVEL